MNNHILTLKNLEPSFAIKESKRIKILKSIYNTLVNEVNTIDHDKIVDLYQYLIDNKTVFFLKDNIMKDLINLLENYLYNHIHLYDSDRLYIVFHYCSRYKYSTTNLRSLMYEYIMANHSKKDSVYNSLDINIKCKMLYVMIKESEKEKKYSKILLQDIYEYFRRRKANEKTGESEIGLERDQLNLEGYSNLLRYIIENFLEGSQYENDYIDTVMEGNNHLMSDLKSLDTRNLCKFLHSFTNKQIRKNIPREVIMDIYNCYDEKIENPKEPLPHSDSVYLSEKSKIFSAFIHFYGIDGIDDEEMIEKIGLQLLKDLNRIHISVFSYYLMNIRLASQTSMTPATTAILNYLLDVVKDKTVKQINTTESNSMIKNYGYLSNINTINMICDKGYKLPPDNIIIDNIIVILEQIIKYFDLLDGIDKVSTLVCYLRLEKNMSDTVKKLEIKKLVDELKNIVVERYLSDKFDPSNEVNLEVDLLLLRGLENSINSKTHKNIVIHSLNNLYRYIEDLINNNDIDLNSRSLEYIRYILDYKKKYNVPLKTNNTYKSIVILLNNNLHHDIIEQYQDLHRFVSLSS